MQIMMRSLYLSVVHLKGEGDPNAVDVADLPANSDALKRHDLCRSKSVRILNDDNDLRSSGVTKSAELTVGNLSESES